MNTLRNEHDYVLGHEGAGEVVGVGSEVTGFSIGNPDQKYLMLFPYLNGSLADSK
jgi:Zn-dependent alcohol dehydrogenase